MEWETVNPLTEQELQGVEAVWDGRSHGWESEEKADGYDNPAAEDYGYTYLYTYVQEYNKRGKARCMRLHQGTRTSEERNKRDKERASCSDKGVDYGPFSGGLFSDD